MSMVRYRRDEIPPATEEEIAEIQALAERPDSEIDYSDIPKSDKLDLKYAISGTIFWTLNNSERIELGRKLLAAKEAERAELKKQRKTAKQLFEAERIVAGP